MDINADVLDKLNVNGFVDFGQFGIPEAIVMLGLGALVLLFGYRIKKIAFFIMWFLLGFNLVGFLMPIIKDAVPAIAENDLYQLLLPIGGGVILGLLGFTIEKICISGIAFILTMLITVQYFGTDTIIMIIGGVVAVASSIVAVMLMKPAVIVLTAIAGAYAIVTALPNLWAEFNAEMLYWPVLGGLAILGTFFQFMTSKKVK